MPFDAMPELPAEARIIDAALEILGLKGKNWVQGQLGNKETGYCVMGAIRRARRRLNLKGDKTVKLSGKGLESIIFLLAMAHSPWPAHPGLERPAQSACLTKWSISCLRRGMPW